MKSRPRRPIATSIDNSDDSSEDDEFSDKDHREPLNLTCPVCLSVMIKPVSLPCRHELCLACLQSAASTWSSLACPLCRKRLSIWMRRCAKDPASLVNAEKWSHIQRLHPEYCRARLEGASCGGGLADPFSPERELPEVAPGASLNLAQPGELQSEWLAAVEAFDAERRARQEAEEAASLALIRRLQLEDATVDAGERGADVGIETDDTVEDNKDEQEGGHDITPGDEERRLRLRPRHPPQHATAPPQPPSRMILRDHHRVEAGVAALPSSAAAAAAAYLRCDSVDSIGPELNQHFRPIHAMPLTPTKEATTSSSEHQHHQQLHHHRHPVRKILHRPKAKKQRKTLIAAAAAHLVDRRVPVGGGGGGGGRRRLFGRSASVQEVEGVAEASAAAAAGEKRLPPHRVPFRQQVSVLVGVGCRWNDDVDGDDGGCVGSVAGSGALGGYSLRLRAHQPK